MSSDRDRVIAALPVTVEAGTSTVIDCGGCAGIVAYPGSGGSMTYRPCDPDGNAVPNTAAEEFSAGTVLRVPWRWLKIAAVSVDGVVCTV